MHSIESDVLMILPDDFRLMAASRAIDAGDWRQILAPQDIHLLPLYRLVRLPFDRRFPYWQQAFHAVVVAAHLAAAALLYLLARRYLSSVPGALATALLFVCARAGDEALLWKAASPFVFSWTFLLLAVWCLTRSGTRWTLAAFASLGCALGFSSGSLLVLPGLLAAVILLEPDSRRRALVVCGGAALAGALVWLALVPPQISLAHYWQAGEPGAASFPARLLDTVLITGRACAYQLGFDLRLVPERYMPLLLPAPVLALLWQRRRIRWPWISAAVLLTAPALFLILLIRRAPGIWTISRYGYQSYTVWAVTAGALLAAVLAQLGPRPRPRAVLLAVAALMAGVYVQQQLYAARHHSAYLSGHPSTRPSFWDNWSRFFRLASDHRLQIRAPLPLPSIEVHPGLDLQTLYLACHPRGLPGLHVNLGHAGSPADQHQFWEEVDRARPLLPGFTPTGRPAPAHDHQHDHR